MPNSDADRGPDHWLYRWTSEEWLATGMRELSSARTAFGRHSTRSALASARRAAGMAWNAIMVLAPNADPRFGRSYADHLRALAAGEGSAEFVGDDGCPLPSEIQDAARLLMEDSHVNSGSVVQLATPRRNEQLLDAAETILAEAYTRVLRSKREPTQ